MMTIPRGIRDIARFKQIIQVAQKHGFAGFDKRTCKVKAESLRKAMEDLGGAFVKLAQLLSLRPDLIPDEYCKEFSRLHDKVRPFSDKEAKQVLRKELQNSSTLTIKKLIASASIGQVYLAEIQGHKLAVKVMRPGIEKTMHTDMDLLYYLAKILRKRMHTDVVDPMEIYEQFRIYTENELDYHLEAKNINIFYKNFLKSDVIIPDVYPRFSSRRVLTMEYIEGIPLHKKKLRHSERKDVADKIANAVFKQIFIDGVFHGDPHPGNILLTPENKIAFIDFGIVCHLREGLRENLSELFAAMITKDIDAVVDSMIGLNLVEYSVHRSELKADVEDLIGSYFDSEIGTVKISDMIISTITAARKHGIKLPKDYVLLGKTFVTLEGVVKSLYPEYNLVEEAKPFVREMLASKFDPLKIYNSVCKSAPKLAKFIAEVPGKTNYFLSELQIVDDRLLAIEKGTGRLQATITRGTNHLVMGIVIASLIISFAIVLPISGAYALLILFIALALLVDIFYTSIMDRKFK